MDNIVEHNKKITDTKYFTIKDSIRAPIKSKTAFIIANERTTKDGSIGRYFTVFPTFQNFLDNRDKYEHCHEILVDHIKNKSNLAGRLVFDFDIKNEKIPKNFKDQIEDVVIEVVENFFNDVDINKLEFIWSTSQNPTKFSKHLTVKHLYFDNWINMSKIFYQLLCLIWDEKYFWIKSNKLIDFQIVRNNGSLRMVGSSKINGYPLIFDNPEHKLTDSLIRIYNQSEIEQIITKENIDENVFTNILCETKSEPNENHPQDTRNNFCSNKIIEPLYVEQVYQKAYQIYNTINPGVFKMGKISGDRVSFIRIKPYKCLLSGKIHTQENSFCRITKDDEFYYVYFGCYRYCYNKKMILIGTVSTKNLLVFIDPNYEPLAKIKRKKNY